MEMIAYDEMDLSLLELFETQFEKSEFDNEVVFPYNNKTETENDSVVKQ
jgi:hypothetical protein